MKVIKLAVISFVFVFIMATLFSLMVPSHLRISKAVNVAADKDSIFSLINNKSNWPRWHPAFQQGKSVDEVLANNKIIITPLIKTDSLVTMQWKQADKRPVINGWQLHHLPSSDSLALQWYMDFDLQWYPWQKFGSLFYENIYGSMMEKGLTNIKSTVQQ